MPDNIHMIAYSHFSVSHQNINHAPYELSNSSCFVLPTTQKFIPKFVVHMASIAYSIWMIGSESSSTSTFLSIVNLGLIMSTIYVYFWSGSITWPVLFFLLPQDIT